MAQQNSQNGNNQQQGENSVGSTFEKGINKDLNDSVMPQGSYYNAINASISLPDGNTGTISTEPANLLSLNKAPLKLIGREYMTESQYITFWTDNTVSEIGIYNDLDSSYQVLINDSATLAAGLPGMGFKTTNLITCSVRRGFDCGFDVYWSDGRLNPDRKLNTATCPFNTADPNLVPNPWFQIVTHPIPGCDVFTNTDRVDIRQLLLEPQFNIPCLTLSKSNQSGTLINGKYQVCMAYAANGVKVTDYVALSNQADVWSHIGKGGGVVLKMTNLETITFREMEIVVISFTNQNVQAKRLGFYSTSEATIYIDNISPELYTIPIQNIPITTPGIISSDAIYNISNYLLRVGTTERSDLNYQPLANQITAKWVCVEYPDSYYHQGGINGFPMNVGMMRGEVYAPYIRWRYTTGDVSAAYPLVCPNANATFSIGGPSVGDGGVTLCSGGFDVYISSEKYPSSVASAWGAVCGQPIRWFKFPDQATFSGVPGQLLSHYWNYGTAVNPSMTIRVMGWVFGNIQPPVDLNGNLVPDIQGYEILRATRDGNASILAKGMVCKTRGYKQADWTPVNNHIGVYQNYPYDSMHKDRFLTSDQTIGTVGGTADYYQGNELDIVNTRFVSFHSPETTFQNPFLGKGVIELTMALAGTAQGSFDIPYKHPKFKLLTRLTSTFAAVISGLNVSLDIYRAATGFGGGNISLAASSDLPIITTLGMSAYPDGPLGSLATVADIASAVFSVVLTVLLAPIEFRIVQQQIMNVVNGLVPAVQYARQYNSHAFYSQPVSTYKGFCEIADYDYILAQIQDFGGTTINNLYRNNFLALKLNNPIPDFPIPYNTPSLTPSGASTIPGGQSSVWLGIPGTSGGGSGVFGAVIPGPDDSLFTLGQGPASPYPSGARASLGTFGSPVVSWYGAYKIRNFSQYGQVDSPKLVPISCMIPVTPGVSITYTSPVLFGGDTYINRYTEKNPFLYFNDWLYNTPDDLHYDYTQYENVPYPRYWINNSKIYYDFWQDADRNWHLDELGNVTNQFWVKNGYFYLFNNGVRDFYVESTINVACRDYGDSIPQLFYNPYGFTDLAQMFRSDILRDNPVNFYKYDYSLSANRFWNQWLSWAQCLRRDFDPALAYTCFAYYPRRVNYSLPQSEEQVVDNWSIFLANNYTDFDSKVTNIQNVGKSGALFLQDDASPMLLPGVESIPSSSGTQFSAGIGALFQQQLQSISNAQSGLQYGSSQGRYCAVNTPHGLYWVSQRTGKLFRYAHGQQDDEGEILHTISKFGMKYWLAQYLPSQLLKQFPDYPYFDNPVIGVGTQIMYDNTTEILYITKKDFVLLSQHVGKVRFTGTIFSYNTGKIEFPITLGDPTYWDNASWTLSYSPKERKFISFHTWEPALSINGERHIITSDPTGQSIWRHNDTTTAWCNYYGVQSYFELELPVNTGLENVCIENIEYVLDSFQYLANETDKFNVFADTFNEAQVFTEEQSTLPLTLVQRPWNDPYGALAYPFITAAGSNILFTKVENKFRFGQGLRDYCNDRGQFGVGNIQMRTTSPNGYSWSINLGFFDFLKSPFQLKKIRHRSSRLLLRKNNITTNSLSLLSVHTNLTKSYR